MRASRVWGFGVQEFGVQGSGFRFDGSWLMVDGGGWRVDGRWLMVDG